MSDQAKTHIFRDTNDERSVVVTLLLPTGEYKAYVSEGKNADVDVRGYGDTRMAAIADLNAKIEASGMSRFSYEDRAWSIAVKVDGKVTGHILREDGLWRYRLRDTGYEGHCFKTVGEVIEDLEGAPVDWPAK